MKSSEKATIELILKVIPIVLSLVSLLISYKTYNSQFQEKFVIDKVPAKFLYIDQEEKYFVYENEIIITNASRNPSSLIKCDVRFSNSSIQNNLDTQFPLLFSPGEAKKFNFKTYIPIRDEDVEILSLSQNSIEDFIHNNKHYRSVSVVIKSVKKTYYCPIQLK